MAGLCLDTRAARHGGRPLRARRSMLAGPRMDSILDRVLQAARQLGRLRRPSQGRSAARLPDPGRAAHGPRRPAADPRGVHDVRAVDMMNDRQRDEFETTCDVDLAYATAGRRALPRQRVPAARATRHGHAPDPARGARRSRSSNLPEAVLRSGRRASAAWCWSPASPARASRPRWPRMIDYINARRAVPHRHRRGSDRVRVPRPARGGQPARGRLRHPVVRQGAARGAAPGSRRDPGRRDARPGDHRDRDDRRRDRPPGAVDPAHRSTRSRPSTASCRCSRPTSRAGAAAARRPSSRAWSRSGCCRAPTARGWSRRSRCWSTPRACAS